jgi:hypothetical protein
MKMDHLLQKSLAVIVLCLQGALLIAQSDSVTVAAGTHCNLFYVRSDAPEVLPFNDQCFVVEEYRISDPHHFRTFGPVEGNIDLFGHFPWAINFFLPDVKERDRLRIVTPKDFQSHDLKVKEGEFFITLTDNRGASRFDPVSDMVDFIAVGGTGRVTAFRPQEGDMPYAEYDLQIDVRVQKVDRSGEYPRLDGLPIRLRMSLVVEALD